MKKSVCLLIAVIFLASLGPLARSSAFVRQSGGFALPILKRDALLNGLSLILMERPGTGTVNVRLRIKSGAMFDLAGKGGLADITAGMLLRGGGGYRAKDVRETIDQIGATLNILVGWDSTDITISGPSASIEAMFDLLGRLLITPAFDPKELDDLKAERIEAVRKEQSETGARTEAKAVESVYGSHPYGRPARGTADSISKITRADLLYYHGRFYLANNAAMVITGEATAEEVTRLARARLGAWKKGDLTPATFRPPEKLSSRNVFILDRGESPVSQAVIALTGVSRRAEDYFAAMIAFEILRERCSKISFGARIETVIEPRFLQGPLTMRISAPTADLPRVIEAALSEMAQLQSGTPSLELVEWAKAQIISAMGESLKDPLRVVDLTLEIETYGLGRDYLVTFGDRVSAVAPADVARAAQSYLSSQTASVVVSGQATRFEALLKNIGPVTVMP